MRGFVILLAAVLGSIGIGAGIEAALQPAGHPDAASTATTPHGPPGGRFTAAFPPPPTVQALAGRGVFVQHVYTAREGAEQLSVRVVTAHGTGWTGDAPVGSPAGSVQVFALTNGRHGTPSPRHVVLRPATVAGERVILGVACPQAHQCVALLSGLLGRARHRPFVVWSGARALVASLRPLPGQ